MVNVLWLAPLQTLIICVTLAVVFTLGIAYLMFFEPHYETTAEHAVSQRRILHVHADQVRSMHLRRDAWTAATLERIDAATFKRTEPLPGAVDSPAVAELLSELEFQDHLTALDGHGSDPGHLYDEGLTPPLLTVTLTLVDGRELVPCHSSLKRIIAVGTLRSLSAR